MTGEFLPPSESDPFPLSGSAFSYLTTQVGRFICSIMRTLSRASLGDKPSFLLFPNYLTHSSPLPGAQPVIFTASLTRSVAGATEGHLYPLFIPKNLHPIVFSSSPFS